MHKRVTHPPEYQPGELATAPRSDDDQLLPAVGLQAGEALCQPALFVVEVERFERIDAGGRWT